MDTDWCLTCDRHFEGSGPYCSVACEPIRAGPSSFCLSEPESLSDAMDEDDIIYHHVDTVSREPWIASGDAGILAWASQVPAGAPAGVQPPFDDTASLCSSSTTSSLSSSTYRAPKLLRPHTRPVPPTLCMSTPQPAPISPSLPIVTPQQHIAALSAAHSADAESASKNSLFSAATESSVATPASSHPVPISAADRKPSVLGSIASQVRSWVAAPASPLASRASLSKRAQPPKADRHPSALRIVSSSQSSLDLQADEPCPPSWWLSVDTTPSKAQRPPARGRPMALELPFRSDEHPSYRARGRKASRAAA